MKQSHRMDQAPADPGLTARWTLDGAVRFIRLTTRRVTTSEDTRRLRTRRAADSTLPAAFLLSLGTVFWLGAAGTLVAEDVANEPAADARQGLWSVHIQPLLQKKCFRCHGGATRKSDLDLRTRETILKGGERGPAIVPGKPEESLIFKVVRPDAEFEMPPDGKNALSEEEILLVRRWIEGASGRNDWSAEKKTADAPRETSEDHELPPPGLTPHLVIDLLIESGWKERGVEPSARCDDRTFVRRVYLDLAGRIPSAGETRAFLDDTRSDKRERLVGRLLDGPDYPRRLREVFDVVLMGRARPGTIDRRRSSQWYDYLEWAFRAGRPWNEIVRDVVVARPARAEEHGAVSFLREGRNKHQEIAERVSPALFGLQVQCAQCHDHPVAPEIEQRHYWGLVAFFSRSTNTDTKDGPGVAESAIGGFSKFADLKGENHDAVLAFFDGQVVPETRPKEGEKETDSPDRYLIAPPAEGEHAEHAAVPKFSRRAELFKLASSSDLLARAFVNRMWALLMGRGLVHPVDKMDSAHPPSHPRLLSWLARDFRESGYDVKRLVRSITSSRAYQLDSRVAAGETSPLPEAFAYALDKPLSAETLYRSMLIASGKVQVESGRGPEIELDAPDAYRFAVVFPDLFPEENMSNLKQALFLTNSPIVEALLEPADGNTTARLLVVESDEDLVRQAFDIVFGRAPEEAELERSVAYLRARKERREDGVKQLLWAMLTSAEFRMNR